MNQLVLKPDLKSRQLYWYFTNQCSCFRVINYNAISVALIRCWHHQKSVVRCYRNLSESCTSVTPHGILEREYHSTI